MHLWVKEATICSFEDYCANCVDALRFNFHIAPEVYAEHLVIIVKSEVPGSDHGQLHLDDWRAVISDLGEVEIKCRQVDQHRVVVQAVVVEGGVEGKHIELYTSHLLQGVVKVEKS